jgi:hypothetical protein
MSELTSIAISVALLGGLCTWLVLSTGTLLIWGAFVAWACFFSSGGDAAALRMTIICNCFGVLVAWLAAVVIVAVPSGLVFGPTVWASLVVAVSIALYISAARVPALSSVPAMTYGYAATFAYLLQTSNQMNLTVLTGLTIENALFLVPLSMVVGALFAFSSAKFAAVLRGSRAVA